MKKPMIALATAGLFSGAGIALACDDYQQDASTNATSMMSVGSPAVIACEGANCNAKPDPTAVTSKKATARTTKKAAMKPEPTALAVQRN
jgi:hypothetical protein